MRIHLTDRLTIEGAGSAVDERTLPPQARLVLAYLIAEGGRPVPRDELAELLWPEGLPQRWEKALAAIVSKLRSALIEIGLSRSRSITSGFGCYQIRLPDDATVDIKTASDQVDSAEKALRAGAAPVAIELTSEAAAIARRTFLPGEDGAWVERVRADLQGMLLRALDIRCEASIAARDPTGAVAAATEAVQLDPFREVGYQRLMQAHVAAGDRSAALRAFERCRALLAEELGVDPSAQTQDLYLQILREGDTRTTTTQTPGSALPAPSGTWRHLAARTTFVGRGSETSAVLSLLEGARLVTITGVGGSGKTRLAVHLADLIGDRSDDVVFVDLTTAADGSEVPRLVAASVGALDRLIEAEQTAHVGAIEDHIVRSVEDRLTLIVLDNCEHVLAAAASMCDVLLDRCPGVRILATSHEPLDVPGEHVYPLAPLMPPEEGVTDAREVAAAPAAHLFLDRARSVRPWFSITPQNAGAIAEICRKVEGLPLAIELASSKIGVLSPAQIAERLDDVFRLLAGGAQALPERHRTLMATMDWAYDLLQDDERAVLRRLGVFAGGCSLEAAEAVCAGDPVPEGGVLHIMERLIDKSLVVADPSGARARYRLLEPVRQFALSKLTASGEEAAIRRSHRDWYLARLSGWESVGAIDVDRTEALEAERANLASAFRWSVDRGDGRLALRIATDTAIVLRPVGLIAASRAMLDEALRIADAAPSERRTTALGLAAWCDSEIGNLAQAQERFIEAVGHARALGAPALIAWMLFGLGHVSFVRGDNTGATDALDEALRLHRASSDHVGAGWALQHLAVIAFASGDTATTRRHLEALEREAPSAPSELEGIRRAVLANAVAVEGDLSRARTMLRSGMERLELTPFARAWGDLYAAGMELSCSGELETARRHLRRAILFQRSTGFVEPLADSLTLAACVGDRDGRPEEASTLFGAADAVRDDTGLRPEPEPWRAAIERHRALVRDSCGVEAFEFGRALSRSKAVDVAVAVLADPA